MASEDVEQRVKADNASTFEDEGMYLCRPDEPDAEKVYYASIAFGKQVEELNPTVSAVVCVDGKWQAFGGINNFWIDSENDDSGRSVFWYLRETAPAALYGVSCVYELENKKIELIYKVLYTDDWTYIQVTNDKGECRVTDYFGEEPLALNITFNNGAASPKLKETATESDGILHGAIEYERDIVSLENMINNITIKTVSGVPVENFDWEIDSNNKNRLLIRFYKRLSDDMYIVQLSSDAKSSIIGQFVIDKTGSGRGVNLSQIWAILMILGGVLSLVAASGYLVPFAIVKINEARVDKENERVDRMKNPEKYAESDKKSLKGMISKVIYNIKTPAYKRKKDKEQEQAEKPVEEKVYTNRFTEMLRERQEKRDFMRENNVTSEEMERMKEEQEKVIREEANSFASLRDDDDEDDEIATFHAAEEEISTLETGSYVKDGTTFAQLDSMRNDEPKDGNDNDGK